MLTMSFSLYIIIPNDILSIFECHANVHKCHIVRIDGNKLKSYTK